MPYSDKCKQRDYQRAFQQKKKTNNPMWHGELSRRNEQKRQMTRDIVTHIKRTFGCLLCGERNPDMLQFHHVLQEAKISTIAEMICNRKKLFTVLKEIDKCVCVCAACHKELHSTIAYVKDNIKKERWYKDWGINEALEWASHPQSRKNNTQFMEIIKAVARNCQMQDPKQFGDSTRT